MQQLKNKLKHQKLCIHSKLLVFRHFFRWVGYCVFLDWQITIGSRKLIFKQTKFPMTPKQKMCVVYMARYSHLLLRASNVYLLYVYMRFTGVHKSIVVWSQVFDINVILVSLVTFSYFFALIKCELGISGFNKLVFFFFSH